MRSTIFISVVIVLISCNDCLSQTKSLFITNSETKEKIIIRRKSKVNFYLIGDDKLKVGRIQKIGDSSVVIADSEYAFSEFTGIGKRKSLVIPMMALGAGISVASALIFKSPNDDQCFECSSSNPSSIIAFFVGTAVSGIILKTRKHKIHKIEDGFEIQIILEPK
jgi:hypothetical protein